MLGRSIRSRLFIGFGAICGLLAVSVTISILRLDDVEQRSHTITREDLPAAQQSLTMAMQFNGSLATLYRYLLTKDPASKHVMDAQWSKIVEAGNALDAVVGALAPAERPKFDIARNIRSAASGAGAVSHAIGEVTDETEHTRAASSDVRRTADDLAARAGRLRQRGDGFLAGIRSAA